MICGLCFPLFLLVCFVCIVEIFVPRVSSLQSLTLGTRSVICSSPLNLVSDTGHKSAPLWFILTPSATTGVSPFFANKGYHPSISVYPERDMTSARARDYAVDLESLHQYLREEMANAQL